MVYVNDSTQSFTITLTAFLEGFGNIVYIEFGNLTQMTSAWWDGTWSGPLEAVEADSISIYVEVENTGAATDTLYAEFDGVDPAEPSLQEMPGILVGNAGTATWTFTMPPQNITIDIYAGHVE